MHMKQVHVFAQSKVRGT